MTTLLLIWITAPLLALAVMVVCQEWREWRRRRAHQQEIQRVTRDLRARLRTARPRLDDDDAPTMGTERCGSIGHAWLTRQHWRSCPRCGAYRRLREETER